MNKYTTNWIVEVGEKSKHHRIVIMDLTKDFEKKETAEKYYSNIKKKISSTQYAVILPILKT